MSPTARTLAECRKLHYVCQKVEHFNHWARATIDLFGCIDIIALTPDRTILGIQATTGDHHAERRLKAMAEPRLWAWLDCGGQFEIWSYRKGGPSGKVKHWSLRRERILPGDVDCVPWEWPATGKE